MAGTLVLDTLQNGAGTASTSADNVIRGCAKAWGSVNPTTVTLGSSYNCSSVTRTATGKYTVNFTIAMPNNTYAVATSVVLNNLSSNESYYAPSTTSVSFEIVDAGVDSNAPSFAFAVFSN